MQYVLSIGLMKIFHEIQRAFDFLVKRMVPIGTCLKSHKNYVNNVTGRVGPQGIETSRLPKLRENKLRDGVTVVNFMNRLAAP
jgi:hypothetical protein